MREKGEEKGFYTRAERVKDGTILSVHVICRCCSCGLSCVVSRLRHVLTSLDGNTEEEAQLALRHFGIQLARRVCAP